MSIITKRRKMNGNLYHLSYSLMIVFFTCFCTPKDFKIIDTKNVMHIYFGAVPYGIETPFDIEDPSQILGWDEYRDTLITDSVTINRFVSLVNSLKPAKEKAGLDIRIIASITTTEGIKHRLCFGYIGGTSYDGVEMEDNDELFSFLDSLIYANHDLEYWAPSFYKEAIEQGLEPVPDNWKKKRGQRQSTLKD